MLLNCYQRSTFVAPQTALYQPANLQSQSRTASRWDRSLAAARASPSNRPSKALTPWRSSPARVGWWCPCPEQGDDAGAGGSGSRAISCDYAVVAELPAIDAPIHRDRPQGRLTQPNSPPDVLHAVQRARPADTDGLQP